MNRRIEDRPPADIIRIITWLYMRYIRQEHMYPFQMEKLRRGARYLYLNRAQWGHAMEMQIIGTGAVQAFGLHG